MGFPARPHLFLGDKMHSDFARHTDPVTAARIVYFASRDEIEARIRKATKHGIPNREDVIADAVSAAMAKSGKKGGDLFGPKGVEPKGESDVGGKKQPEYSALKESAKGAWDSTKEAAGEVGEGVRTAGQALASAKEVTDSITELTKAKTWKERLSAAGGVLKGGVKTIGKVIETGWNGVQTIQNAQEAYLRGMGFNKKDSTALGWFGTAIIGTGVAAATGVAGATTAAVVPGLAAAAIAAGGISALGHKAFQTLAMPPKLPFARGSAEDVSAASVTTALAEAVKEMPPEKQVSFLALTLQKAQENSIPAAIEQAKEEILEMPDEETVGKRLREINIDPAKLQGNKTGFSRFTTKDTVKRIQEGL